MATRSSVKIDGVNLYSHWDGYPMGMVVKFYQAIDKLHTFSDYGSKQVPFINAFIAGNIDNCELDLKQQVGGLEYRYEINSKDMTIKAFEIHWDTEKASLIFDGTIFDFISKYHKENRDRKSFLEGEEAVYLVTEKSRWNDSVRVQYYTEKNMKQYVEQVTKHIEEYGEDNPNKKISEERLNVLIDAKIIKGA